MSFMGDLCTYGLFAGVDCYDNRGKNRLDYAWEDARRLRDRFRAAWPAGDWMLLPDRKPKINGRSHLQAPALLRGLMEFAARVPISGTGLFYFSGHASAVNGSLTLKTFGTDDSLLTDTGVSVSRVLQILKTSCDKRFVVILDCCREGDATYMGDNIPPNVDMLYACSAGHIALEDENGGMFTKSMLDSLDKLALERGERYCSLQSIWKQLARPVFAWRPAGKLVTHAYGDWSDKCLLPITAEPSEFQQKVESAPRATIHYNFASRNEYEIAYRVVGRRIFDWYSASYEDTASRAFVAKHFELSNNASERNSIAEGAKQDSLSADNTKTVSVEKQLASSFDGESFGFKLRIPMSAPFWRASDFVTHILSTNWPEDAPGVIETLEFEWSRPVPVAVLRRFQGAVDGEMTRGLGNGRLHWQVEGQGGTYRGVASLLPTYESTTSIYISCETVGSDAMPLRLLLPALRDQFDLIQGIQV